MFDGKDSDNNMIAKSKHFSSEKFKNETFALWLSYPDPHAPYEVPEKYFKEVSNLNYSLGLKHLSMGMSGDYKIALKFNSTFLRIGSAIFGARIT